MAFMAIAFLPLYVSILGAEAFALVSIHASIIAVASFLDLGLSTGITQRLGVLDRDDPKGVANAKDLLRSFEILYWSIGAAIAIVLALGSQMIVQRWLHLEHMPVEVAQRGMQLISAYIFLQWPQSLYSGALVGLYKPVKFYQAKIFQVTFQNVGGYLLMKYYEPSPLVFLWWQILICLIAVIMMQRLTWSELSEKFIGQGRLKWQILKENFSYFKGLSAMMFWGVILGQSDRIMISKLLPLEALGYYSLAASLANGLQYIGAPLYASVLPKLSRLMKENDEAAAKGFYFRSSIVLANIVIPGALMITFFSHEILQIWTQNSEIVTNTEQILSLIVLGTALNAIMLQPLALQLSVEWTKLSIYKNVIAAAIYLPVLYLLVTQYGAIGGAMCWTALNALYIAIEVPIMHQRLFKGSLWAWYRSVLVYPSIVSLMAIYICSMFFVHLPGSRFLDLGVLAFFTLIAIVTSFLCQKLSRDIIVDNVRKLPLVVAAVRNRMQEPRNKISPE